MCYLNNILISMLRLKQNIVQIIIEYVRDTIK